MEAVRLVNLPYTILLGLLLLYWLTVILGVLDVETLDLHADAHFEVDHFFGFLNFGAVPFSIWLTIFAFQMWLYSVVSNAGFDALFSFRVPNIVRFLVELVFFIPISVIITKWVTTPLSRIFDIPTVRKRDFTNRECEITSSVVNETFGTAEIRYDGTVHNLDIRTKQGETLKKFERALIYEYDESCDMFYVTSL